MGSLIAVDLGACIADTPGVMRMRPMLSQITDGKAAWAEFLSGVERAFESNAQTFPVLVAIVVIALIIWLDLRLARILARRLGRSQKPKGSRKG